MRLDKKQAPLHRLDSELRYPYLIAARRRTRDSFGTCAHTGLFPRSFAVASGGRHDAVLLFTMDGLESSLKPRHVLTAGSVYYFRILWHGSDSREKM
jgi:hypothetical protein